MSGGCPSGIDWSSAATQALDAVFASTSGWRTVRMRDRDDHQTIYPREVVRIARVERKPVRQGNGSDHRVVGPCVCLPARASKRRRNLAECSGRLDIERKGIEVGFCLLEMGKTGGSLASSASACGASALPPG
jgi:hypothetical protein